MALNARFRPICFRLGWALALALMPGLLSAASAQTVERKVPTQNQLHLSYAPVVKRVAPAVVNVYAAKVVRTQNPFFQDPIFRHFFGVPGGGINQVQRSLGSGVIVDPSGLIVTNVHVIAGRNRDQGGAFRQARVRGAGRAARTSAAISPYCASRTARRAFLPCSLPIPTRCRWATWCSPSAIRSASGRP